MPRINIAFERTLISLYCSVDAAHDAMTGFASDGVFLAGIPTSSTQTEFLLLLIRMGN